jgi:hypothetical protein
VTTSNPTVPQPSGAAHPDGEDHDESVDPLLRDKLAGAVPDESLQDDAGGSTAADSTTEASSADGDTDSTDSVQDDRERSGAD